jgi:hypothetical protein
MTFDDIVSDYIRAYRDRARKWRSSVASGAGRLVFTGRRCVSFLAGSGIAQYLIPKKLPELAEERLQVLREV